MPGKIEWVQPKAYNRWKFPEIDLDHKKSARRTKSGKPGKPGEEEPTKPVKDPGPQDGPPQSGSPKGPTKTPPQKPTSGPPRGIGGPPPAPEPLKPATPRLEAKPGPGQDLAPREPGNRSQWGHVEILRPPAIGDRPEAPAREHPSVPQRELPTSDRQFKPLGAAPDHAVTEADRRRQAFAEVVRSTRENMAKKELGAGEHTGVGEIVQEGKPFTPRSGNTDKSIWDAVEVGHNEGKSTGKIRAIGAPSHAAATGPVPRIHDTAPINRTAPLPKTISDTAPLPTMGRQFAMPGRLALTQRPEPFGQMSMFDVSGALGDVHLSEAQASRSEQQSVAPRSTMPSGRQVNFMQPHLPKKPGSQGTLFKPVSFKTL